MSLTREALDKWLQYAQDDLQNAPADGMLVYLIEKLSKLKADRGFKVFTRHDVEVIAVAYAKALQEYVRPRVPSNE